MSTQNVTPQEFSYLKEQLTARMIQILVEEHGYTMEEAIDKIYTSPIYEKLSDANTGLFFQSPRYVLSYIADGGTFYFSWFRRGFFRRLFVSLHVEKRAKSGCTNSFFER